MTKRDQKRIVRELCDSIRSCIYQAIEARTIPETWDGVELRQYLAELAMNSRATMMQHSMYSRRKDYDNTVLVNNL